MHYSMYLQLFVATLLSAKLPQDNPNADAASLPEVVDPALQRLLALVETFRTQPVSPAATHQFKLQLQEQLRDLGCAITEWTYNHLEPADVAPLPKHVWNEN